MIDGPSQPHSGKFQLTDPFVRTAFLDPPIGQVHVRIPRSLYLEMQADLTRPHPFADERVGFLSVTTSTSEGTVLILGVEYHVIPDDHYVDDPTVGARIGTPAIRSAIQQVASSKRGIFHVHMHSHHAGVPRFSGTDRTEQPQLVRAFQRIAPAVPHGMLVLSQDQANAWIWLPETVEPITAERLTIVGVPMTWAFPGTPKLCTPDQENLNERYSRQSFLGPQAQHMIDSARIGLVGLGGGGSHIAQQLAYVGFRSVRGFDGDTASDSNLNRLVNANPDDVRTNTAKTDIARRPFTALGRDEDVFMYAGRWQDKPDVLRGCDIIFGCVDTFAARQELEVLCRRYAIPYIDIGMDVHCIEGHSPRMGGQVILSMPGKPCFWCLGFLTPERMAQEAARYGDAGGRPQVVWPNGVLASTAVGIAVDLVTSWTGRSDSPIYLSYDGNHGTLSPHVRLRFLTPSPCDHYPLHELGDPRFRPLKAS